MNCPLRRNFYDWVLLIGAFGFLMASFAPLLKYGEMGSGEIVPVHYDMRGNIDGWATKASFIYVALTALVLYIVMLLSARFYYKSGLSVKFTDQNRIEVYRLRVRLYRKTNLILMIIFAYVNNLSAAFTLGMIDESSWLFNPIIITLLVIVLIVENAVYFVRVNML